MEKLFKYYLECLSKGMAGGISCRAINANGTKDYGQMFKLPQLTNNTTENIFNSADIQNIIDRVRLDRNRIILQLGYPIHLRKVVINNHRFFVVEPIFLIPFDSQSFANGGRPALLNEMPQFNYEALKHISGLINDELFEEVNKLSDEIGLNKPPADQPNFEELVIRLQNLRPQWNWKETINPNAITNQILNRIPEGGIYNSAALFFSEPSKFVKGLVKELNELIRLNDNEYNSSVLGQWINRNIPIYDYQEKAIIEPIPLNDEQRNAVKKAHQAP